MWCKMTSRDSSFGSSTTSEYVGPGSYNVADEWPKKSFSTRGSHIFTGKAKRNTDLNQSWPTPSAADYNLSIQSTRIGKTSDFKSKSKRNIFNISDTPSPADYSNQTVWAPEQSHRFSSSYYMERPYSPNVGQDVLGYEIDYDGTAVPVKKKYHGEEWVGPGSYSPPETQKKGRTISKKPHSDPIRKRDSTPGPGEYDPQSTNSRSPIACSIRPKIPLPDPEPQLHGEIKHELWVSSQRTGTSNFKSKSKRQIFEDNQHTPSPVSYHKQRNHKPTQSLSAFGQRSSRFVVKTNDTPGPGAYEAKPAQWVKQGPEIVPKARRAERMANQVTSPGSYNIH